jgi:CheY-like chemotaxis protein/predicted transcriptional regulator
MSENLLHFIMPRLKEPSFSIAVIRRFLTALLEGGKMKKTSLAGKAGINYGMCVKYARFLARIGWIKTRADSDKDDGDIYEYLSLTLYGKQILEILNSDYTTDVSITNIIVESELDIRKKIDGSIHSNNRLKMDSTVQNGMTHLSSSFSDLTIQKSSPHSDTDSAKKKVNTNVMIVDDDTDILLTYNLILNSCGYNVKTFSDPIEALMHFAENSSSYDLLILDIRMPHINGIQLFQTFKSINRNVKVMFVSCLDSTPELVSIFPEVKQDEVLAKPITAENFVNAVQRILN